MTKDKILGALPKLSQPDLEAIIALATSLTNGRTGALQKGADTVSQTILTALAATAGLNVGSISLPERTQQQFNKRCPKFISFLDEHFKGWAANKNSQLAFLKMLFELLADDLKERGINPSIGIMVVNLGRIPEVIDAAFPDYRASGMTDLILRHFK